MDHPLRRPEEILAYRTLDRVLGPKPWSVWSVGPRDSVMAALQIMSDRDIGFSTCCTASPPWRAAALTRCRTTVP